VVFRNDLGLQNYAEIIFYRIMKTRWASIYSLGLFQVRGSLTYNSLGEEILVGRIIWKNLPLKL